MNDGTDGFDDGLAGLRNLIDSFDEIQRTALNAVADVVKPRLATAAPERVSVKQGGNSLPPGALKAAVRSRVNVGKQGTAKSDQATVQIDFGKLTHIADFVDRGHKPPNSRLAGSLGREVASKPTPAHPFIRSVEDSSRETAQQAYRDAMTEGITKALEGK